MRIEGGFDTPQPDMIIATRRSNRLVRLRAERRDGHAHRPVNGYMNTGIHQLTRRQCRFKSMVTLDRIAAPSR